MSVKVNRRNLFLSATAFAIGTTVSPVWADDNNMDTAIKAMFGDQKIKEGKVTLKIPALSENGFSVAFEAEVDSPMTQDDYVKRIVLFSERNPISLLARYNFTPRSGRAKVNGRVRLAGTQNLHAIAEMSDGRLYRASANTFVTVAACIIL